MAKGEFLGKLLGMNQFNQLYYQLLPVITSFCQQQLLLNGAGRISGTNCWERKIKTKDKHASYITNYYQLEPFFNQLLPNGAGMVLGINCWKRNLKDRDKLNSFNQLYNQSLPVLTSFPSSIYCLVEQGGFLGQTA